MVISDFVFFFFRVAFTFRYHCPFKSVLFILFGFPYIYANDKFLPAKPFYLVFHYISSWLSTKFHITFQRIQINIGQIMWCTLVLHLWIWSIIPESFGLSYQKTTAVLVGADKNKTFNFRFLIDWMTVYFPILLFLWLSRSFGILFC